MIRIRVERPLSVCPKCGSSDGNCIIGVYPSVDYPSAVSVVEYFKSAGIGFVVEEKNGLGSYVPIEGGGR